MKKRNINSFKEILLFLFVIASSLQSCGPIYDSRRQFDPPASDQGKMCIDRCDTKLRFCKDEEQLEENISRSNAQGQDGCYLPEQRLDRGCIGIDFADLERCQDNYERCFEDCGGVIKIEKRCVLNCEEALGKQ